VQQVKSGLKAIYLSGWQVAGDARRQSGRPDVSGPEFEDQLSSEKKCGHMGGKVLVPTQSMIATLTAARLAPTCWACRPSCLRAPTHTAPGCSPATVDRYDQPFLTGERTTEGFFRVRDGIESAIARGLAYAPYADLLWCETSEPDLDEAQYFADAIHARFPDKMLAYNCSPSFNWKRKLDDATIADFQRSLAKMGYRFQFITLAGFHALNHSMFELAYAYQRTGMAAYATFQQAEFASEARGYNRHAPPARSWRRLFRRRSHGHQWRRGLDDRAARLNGRGTVHFTGVRARRRGPTEGHRVMTAASSMTNEVWRLESSVPVNLMVMVWPL